MPDEFLSDYILLVFLSAMGVLQVVAARSGLLGLLFLRQWPRVSQWLGSALVVAAFAWYSTDELRNIPDTDGGLEGNTQALWFALSAGTGVALTFALSSIVNHRWAMDLAREHSGGSATADGITALERTTFARALGSRLASWVRP